MTEHEMQIRFAKAMGWTEIRDIPAGGLVGVPPGGGGALTPIPNPREDDADAARLRAWCVGQGWNVTVCHHIVDCRCAVWPRGVPLYGFKGILGLSAVRINEESDPCSRERRVTCEAVIQALDTIEAGGTDE
jgi:hypothetical protein